MNGAQETAHTWKAARQARNTLPARENPVSQPLEQGSDWAVGSALPGVIPPSRQPGVLLSVLHPTRGHALAHLVHTAGSGPLKRKHKDNQAGKLQARKSH